MFRNKVGIIFLMLLGFCPALWAVTEQDVWVPKRHGIAKNKLLSTAVEAERAERCVKAIQGRMSVSKSTAKDYYFIITCRDSERKTYNVAYSYPVDGAMPVLINEQIIIEPVIEVAEVLSPGISINTAWPLCLNKLKDETRSMLDVLIVEENPTPSDEGEPEQVLDIDFDAKNPDGLLLRYQAHCEVDVDKNVSLSIRGRKTK